MCRAIKWNIPVKKFVSKNKSIKDVQFPIDGGMFPEKQLEEKPIYSSEDIFEIV